MSDTDETAPWYEFVSYIRCCESLGVTPSLTRFFRYNQYYNSLFKEHTQNEN